MESYAAARRAAMHPRALPCTLEHCHAPSSRCRLRVRGFRPGVVAGIGSNFEVRLQGSNLTNQIGLTEGNARVTTAGISGGFEMARPIFGREGQLQLRYKF
jgi:hypothetical protein